MAHATLLLNTGQSLLLNDGTHLLLNRAGPSQVHLVGVGDSASIQRTKLKPVQTQIWIKAGIKRRVQLKLSKFEKLLNPKTFSRITSLPITKIRQTVKQVAAQEAHNIVRSAKTELFFLKQELKKSQDEELMKDPIAHGHMLKEILKRLKK